MDNLLPITAGAVFAALALGLVIWRIMWAITLHNLYNCFEMLANELEQRYNPIVPPLIVDDMED